MNKIIKKKIPDLSKWRASQPYYLARIKAIDDKAHVYLPIDFIGKIARIYVMKRARLS